LPATLFFCLILFVCRFQLFLVFFYLSSHYLHQVLVCLLFHLLSFLLSCSYHVLFIVSLPYLAASTGATAKRSPSLWFLVFLPYFTYRTGFSGHPPCLSSCLQPFCSHCFTPRSLLCPVYSLVNKKKTTFTAFLCLGPLSDP